MSSAKAGGGKNARAATANVLLAFKGGALTPSAPSSRVGRSASARRAAAAAAEGGGVAARVFNWGKGLLLGTSVCVNTALH